MSPFGMWLASFALLLQTILPLAYRPAAAQDDALAIDGAFIICTAHGLAKISDADLNLPVKPADSAGKTMKCPLCQVWHSLGNALPVSAGTILGPAHTAAAEPATVAQAAPARFHRDPLQARAPPLTA